jgi:peptide/nickel transport system substrate-binding protein
MAGAPALAQTRPFTIVANQEPDVLDLTITRTSTSARPVLENIVESLIDYGKDDAPAPGIASWAISDDGKIVTFTVRDGVRFHSGDLLTARDIEFSHRRMMQKTPFYQRRMRLLDRTEVVDDRTIRFIFKSPDAGFIPSRPLYVVSKAYFDRVGEKEFVEHPIGTGPYKFVSYRPGEYLDVAAFDDYWQGPPEIKAARFAFVTEDTTRVAKLRAGEADIATNVPYAQVAELRQAGFGVEGIGVHPTGAIQFKVGNPKSPWNDVRVRLAIAEAVDAEAIVKGLFQGVPTHYPALGPDEIGYDPELKPYRFDPTHAKALLREAGFPSGFPMKLYYWTGNYTGLKETAEAVALYLKAIGINVDVQGQSSAQMLELVRKAHDSNDVEVAMIAPTALANFGEPSEALSINYYSKSPYSMYANPKVDAAIEKAQETIDDRQRGDAIRAAIRILHDDVATVPLWNSVSVYATKAGLGFRPTRSTCPLMFLKNVHL